MKYLICYNCKQIFSISNQDKEVCSSCGLCYYAVENYRGIPLYSTKSGKMIYSTTRATGAMIPSTEEEIIKMMLT